MKDITSDDYTPEQRRIIDARLAESKEDFKSGRTYGPFETAAAMINFLHSQVEESGGVNKRKTQQF